MSELNKQLIEASDKGDLTKVKELIENGADVYAQNDYALRCSAEMGHLEVVRFLLENGADIHAQDDCALRWSARFGHLEVVRLFLENGAKQSKLFEVWNKQQIMKEFFEIENCEPEEQYTNELCSESFKLPKDGDWYVVWEDDSITILENVHLVSVEPELVKGVYIQTNCAVIYLNYLTRMIGMLFGR